MTERVVFFSGGISSYCAAKLTIETCGSKNVTLLFTDTLTEDEDLYRFIRDAAHKFQCRFVWLKEGRDVWQVFNDIKFIGNTRFDPCSRILKREIARAWINENAQQAVLVFGFDEFEKNRAERVSKAYAPQLCEFPLIENIISYSAKIDLVLRGGIQLPRLYKLGFSHNNCGGFCVKAGQAHFANLYRTMPERYNYHAGKEREMINKGVKHKGIIRVEHQGVKSYLPLDEFVRHIESGLFDENDTRGCDCFAEDV